MPITQSEARSPSVRDPGSAVSNLQLDREGLWKCYEAVRATTEGLCASLEVEDYVVQSMPDASPAKWHLAHTSWFFETFVLAAAKPGLRAGRIRVCLSFQFLLQRRRRADRARPQRGLLSRPTVAEVYRYRAAVDAADAGVSRTGRRRRSTESGRTFDPGLAPRAAAPGADPHRHQARLRRAIPLRPAYREHGRRRVERACRARCCGGWIPSGRPAVGSAMRGRLRLRQRGAAASGVRRRRSRWPIVW